MQGQRQRYSGTYQVVGVLSAWQEGVAEAAQDRGLRQRLLAQERELFPRFAGHYTKLRALPRRMRRAMQRRWRHTLAGVALLMALGGGSASAAVFNVPCPGGVGDNAALIQAINDANNETANPGPDTINLVANCTHTLTAGPYSFYGPTGLPVVTSEITIDGNGSTIVRMSGAPEFRIFGVSGNLTLQETTVSGGKISGLFSDGGGVLNFGGTLTITDSTISGNSTSGDQSFGGGVYNYSDDDTLTLTRTLISGNTIASGSGSEIYSYPSSITPNAFNLFGHNGLTTAQALVNVTPGATDILATSDCTPGPGCDPTALSSILNTTLANNGGPTQTHALVTNSPAIDAAGMTCSATDQRGVTRPQGAACDIGSFELASAPLCNGLASTSGCTVNGVANQTCVGTPNADVINDTTGNDVIVGLEGNDMVNGRGGNDVICGGDGNDDLEGGGGNDVLDGEGNNDLLRGGNGVDLLMGGAGLDRLFGNAGNDQLLGGMGNDRLLGQNGNDAMDGELGTDRCEGGPGAGDTAANCETTGWSALRGLDRGDYMRAVPAFAPCHRTTLAGISCGGGVHKRNNTARGHTATRRGGRFLL